MFQQIIRYPGHTLALADAQTSAELSLVLLNFEIELSNAIVSYNLREAFRAQLANVQSREDWERERDRRMAILMLLPGFHEGGEARQRAMCEAEAMLRAEQFDAGIIPRPYLFIVPSLFEREYIFAVHTIRELLSRAVGDVNAAIKRGAVTEESLSPSRAALNAARKAIDERLPDLGSVRDTLHHMEDRGRARDKNNESLSLDSGILNLGMGLPEEHRTVLNSGREGGVEISGQVLRSVAEHIQAVISALPWTGAPRFREL